MKFFSVFLPNKKNGSFFGGNNPGTGPRNPVPGLKFVSRRYLLGFLFKRNQIQTSSFPVKRRTEDHLFEKYHG
jgi:hypothetical protein